MVACSFIYLLHALIMLLGKSISAAQSMLKRPKLCFLYSNTFCTCLTHIQRILIARYSAALSTFQYSIFRFSSVCFVKTKHCFLYHLYYATKKWAWHCRCWSENIFNVQSYLWLWLTRYLGEPARQLAVSSPNKISPFKQRFLRKTSNSAFFKNDNPFKYSSYAIEFMCTASIFVQKHSEQLTNSKDLETKLRYLQF